jgi:hypothetical protein
VQPPEKGKSSHGAVGFRNTGDSVRRTLGIFSAVFQYKKFRHAQQ